MYQQHLQNEKSTSRTDLLLVVVFLLLAVFMRQIVGVTSSFPGIWRSLSQLALFAAFVGICLYIYKRRICSYRYTVVFEKAPEGQQDRYGNQLEWPWPIGTVLFERMVANKGKLAEQIAPAELIALVPPEAGSIGFIPADPGAKKPGFFNTTRYTLFPNKTACTLVYSRNGKMGYIVFHPDEVLKSHLATLLAAKGEAAAGQGDA